MLEQEITPGSKILFWTDVNHSLEYVAASLGAAKVGVTIVASDFENWEDIEATLSASKASILVLSPYSQLDNNKTRIDAVKSAIPELNSSNLYIRCNYSSYW